MAIAPWVTGVGGRPELVGATVDPDGAHPRHQRPARGDGLDAADLAAHARRVAAGQRDVADLAGRAERAPRTISPSITNPAAKPVPMLR